MNLSCFSDIGGHSCYFEIHRLTIPSLLLPPLSSTQPYGRALPLNLLCCRCRSSMQFGWPWRMVCILAPPENLSSGRFSGLTSFILSSFLSSCSLFILSWQLSYVCCSTWDISFFILLECWDSSIFWGPCLSVKSSCPENSCLCSLIFWPTQQVPPKCNPWVIPSTPANIS